MLLRTAIALPKREGADMAFTSIAALAAGAEATTALVLGAVTEVGMTMTLVGAVTGNKDLLQIGAVMGAVGGIGGAIVGATDAAAATATGADAVNSFDSGAMQGLVGGASDSGAAIGATNALSDADYSSADWSRVGGDTTATTSPVATSTVEAQPLTDTTTQSTAVTQPVAQSTSTTAATATPTTTTSTDVAGAQAPTGATSPAGAQAPITPVDDAWGPNDSIVNPSHAWAPATSDSLFSKFSDWATKNKTLFNAGVQVIGGGLNGMNQRDIADQKMALQRDMWNRANSVGTFSPTATGIVGRAAA
jgi:hypothetical protein